MSNTYTQIHIQVVFAVQGRSSLIFKNWKDGLYGYITGIIQSNDHKMLQINGVADHVQILFGMRPTQSMSDLMKEVKGSSSRWVNDNKLVKGKFAWQSGYGAFSYSKSEVPNVIRYIQDQEEHHRIVPFLEEYVQLLKDHDLDFDEHYIFEKVL